MAKQTSGDGLEVHAEAKQPTEASLKNADSTSNPVPNDADVHDPPVRSVSPQEPMIQTLAVGAGAHEPVTDPHIGADGRWYADADEAKATRESGRLDETAEKK